MSEESGAWVQMKAAPPEPKLLLQVAVRDITLTHVKVCGPPGPWIQPIMPDYYTHYYKNACSGCVHVITIVIPI